MTEDAAPWVQTFSGGAVDLLSPQPGQILLVDIAHALSRIPRFNGHTKGPLAWNVAQHSLLVESLLPGDADPVTRLLALLHDAHEAYIGDIPSPVKAALQGLTPIVAAGLDRAVQAAFALPEPSEAQATAIWGADMLALRVERDALMASPPRDWLPLPEPPDPLPELVPTMPDEAKATFIARAAYLVGARHGLDMSIGKGFGT